MPIKAQAGFASDGLPKDCVGMQTGCVVVAKSRQMWPCRAAAVKACIEMHKSQVAQSESRMIRFEECSGAVEFCTVENGAAHTMSQTTFNE